MGALSVRQEVEAILGEFELRGILSTIGIRLVMESPQQGRRGGSIQCAVEGVTVDSLELTRRFTARRKFVLTHGADLATHNDQVMDAILGWLAHEGMEFVWRRGTIVRDPHSK